VSGARCVVLGAGGHGIVVASALLEAGVEVVGFVDREVDAAFSYRGLRIVGTDDALPSLAREGVKFVCGVGGVRDNTRRKQLFLRARQAGLQPMTAVHPSAVVDPTARIGEGTFIAAGAIVNPCAELGCNVIVNTGAIVEHHCGLGDHVHVATGAVLGGAVTIEPDAHVGAGAVVRQGIRIGRGSVVGAGAVVVADVADGQAVVGNPARPMAPGAPEGMRV